MKRARKAILVTVVIITAGLLTLPTLVVVPLAFANQRSFAFPPESFSTRWFENFWSDPRWTSALEWSVLVAVPAAVVALIAGLAAAVAMSKMPSGLAVAARVLILLPLLIPNIILAIGTYRLYLDLGLNGSLLGFVVAHAAGALPLVVTPIVASMSTLDKNLPTAAQILGASPWRAFIRITVPSILPGILAGGFFAFIFSWDEVIISLFISAPGRTTLPVQLYHAVANDTDPTLAAVSVMLMTLTTAIVVLVLMFQVTRSRRGR